MDDKIDDLKKEVSDVRQTTIQINEKVNDIKLDVASHLSDFREQVVTQKNMQEDLSNMSVVLKQNTESLIEHMARTKMNEMAIQELKNISLSIDNRLSPLEVSQIERNTINKMWRRVAMIVAGVATAVSTIYTILSFINK